ncbi:MAG TPA: SRPBCC family protein [Solirubrobacteraceae bacterium]
MSKRSTTHSTFVIERTYDAPPERVFDAWSDPAAKARWFGPPEKPEGAYSLDFRVGGSEHLSIALPDGPLYSFDAVYQDIVAGQRILYTYDMHKDQARISVSLATVEIEGVGAGTRLTLTEQGVFLDGLDTSAEREHGTNVLMDTLGGYLLSSRAST